MPTLHKSAIASTYICTCTYPIYVYAGTWYTQAFKKKRIVKKHPLVVNWLLVRPKYESFSIKNLKWTWNIRIISTEIYTMFDKCLAYTFMLYKWYAYGLELLIFKFLIWYKYLGGTCKYPQRNLKKCRG